ncbi:MAG: TetR/AcrR family transcriptional regulator [Cyanobacteriota bacterium]|nr:TetR/AcrR family transcriptional regulator [Cyanobacteriota bacterium]
MPKSRLSTRQRLINQAKELFGRQGITQTTTRQIADAAGVNEVTLFRHFGTKQGLLLAVFAELGVFAGIGDGQPTPQKSDLTLDPEWYQDLVNYVTVCFNALVNNPELTRSVVGEAGLYSLEHRQALRQGFSHAQHQLMEYLLKVDPALAPSESQRQRLVIDSGILHLLILGAAVMQITAGLPGDPISTEPLLHGEESPQKGVSEMNLDGFIAIWLKQSVLLWLQGVGLSDPSRGS